MSARGFYTDDRGRVRPISPRSSRRRVVERSPRLGVKFYSGGGRYAIGVEGGAVRYITDGRIAGTIALSYPMLSGEGMVDVFGRKFWVWDNLYGDKLGVRDEKSGRQWLIPRRLTTQFRIRGVDEEGIKNNMRLTPRNNLRAIVKEVLVPLKRTGQLVYDDSTGNVEILNKSPVDHEVEDEWMVWRP